MVVTDLLRTVFSEVKRGQQHLPLSPDDTGRMKTLSLSLSFPSDHTHIFVEDGSLMEGEERVWGGLFMLESGRRGDDLLFVKCVCGGSREGGRPFYRDTLPYYVLHTLTLE